MQNSDGRLLLVQMPDEERAALEAAAAEAGLTISELVRAATQAAVEARKTATGTGDDDGKPEGWEPEEEDEEETGAADENDDTPQDEARFMDALRRTLERMNIAVQDVLMQALRAVMNSLTKVSAAAVDLMFTAETDEAVGQNGPQPQGHHPAQPEPQAATPACGGPARDERAAQSCPPCAANSAEKAEAGHAASETGNAGGASARADQARPPHGVQQADASGAGERDRGQKNETKPAAEAGSRTPSEAKSEATKAQTPGEAGHKGPGDTGKPEQAQSRTDARAGAQVRGADHQAAHAPADGNAAASSAAGGGSGAGGMRAEAKAEARQPEQAPMAATMATTATAAAPAGVSSGASATPSAAAAAVARQPEQGQQAGPSPQTGGQAQAQTASQTGASAAAPRDLGQTGPSVAVGAATPRTALHTVTMDMPAAETPLRVHTPFDGMGVNDMARMASFGSVSGFPATTGSGGASFEAVCVMNQSAPGTYSGTMNAGFSSVRDTPTMSREPQTDWAWQFAAQQQQASAGRASFTPNDFVHSQPAGERTSGFRSNAYGSGFEVPGEALESERVQTADNTQNHGHSAQNEADNDREAET